MSTGLTSVHAFLGDLSANNRIHNPEFWLAQRYNPTSLNTVTAPAYGFDRWRIQASAGAVGIQRQSATLPSGNDNATYMGYFEKQTANGYMGISQFIENADSLPMVGQQVNFSLWAKANNSVLNGTTLRIVILAWSGTADTLTSSIVTSWAAVPTYATGFTEVASNTVTLSSTNFQEVFVSGTIPSGTTNVAVFVHTTASVAFASGNALLLTGNRLYIGPQNPPFYPRQRHNELSLCQRYYEKSYDIDTAPGTITNSGTLFGMSSGSSASIGGRTMGIISFKINKRVRTYTATMYNPTTGASGSYQDDTGNTAVGPAGFDVTGQTGMRANCGGTSAGNIILCHFTADADL